MFVFRHPKIHVRKARAGNSQEILKKLSDYLNGNSDEPAEILCGFWRDEANVFTYQELREAVMDGYLNENTWQQWAEDYSKLVNGKLRFMWENAFQAGSASQPITHALEKFVVDMGRPTVLDWIKDKGGHFVTNCVDEQRKAIAYLTEKTVMEKHSVDELARLIRPCVGLTVPQTKANVNYYDHVKETLTKDHPRMSVAKVEAKAKEAAVKYAEKQHRQRAVMIAQTEMAYAFNKGADEGVRQAQDLGLIGKVVKRWNTAGDENVCAMCRDLEGKEIAMDDKWTFGPGWDSWGNLTPPAHPRCGCAIEYIEVEKPVFQPEPEIEEETAEAEFDLDTKNKQLSDLEQELQALAEERDAKVAVFMEKQDFVGMGQVYQEYYERIKNVTDQMDAVREEIYQYKESLQFANGHLTREKFWASFPSDWLNEYPPGQDMSRRELISSAISDWTGEGYEDAKHNYYLELAIEQSNSKFSGGKLYRGMTVSDEQLAQMQVGQEAKMDGLSSWSTSRDVAMQFAYTNENPILLEDVTEGERSAISIKAFSHVAQEDEVLYSGEARLKIVGRRTDTVDYVISGERKSMEVTILEVQQIPADIQEPAGVTIANGSNIAETFVRRQSEFTFEIEDVMNAQGFDGMPRVVGKEEFDRAVSESSFIAQRTYSAPTKEILDEYHNQLYNGKWYVDCSTGGAQYGQGMYCAADYTGTLTDGIKEEMDHYQKLGKDKGNPLNITETFTLDPSAKVIKHEELKEKFYNETSREHFFEEELQKTDLSKEELAVIHREILRDATPEQMKLARQLEKELDDDTYDSFMNKGYEIQNIAEKKHDRYKDMDLGVYASLLGYDAINAEGHGASASYTVVLNRTKVIFLGE